MASENKGGNGRRLSGGGGVVRDSEGGFHLAFPCFFGVATSLHAELKVLVHGVGQSVARGYLDIHLEVDSLSLVRIISGAQACPWHLQLELDDLLRYQSLFRSITHCYREANKLADRLAKLGAERGADSLFQSFAVLPPLVL
ncbi:uncharacterized protein LOC113771254 [Coffea eugenioides]|uniref:uncharacterized protein LOC113771254 n=1 Tax=Coffea eugenioides TaxID=49369 RepID=UPI000F61193C|nr:uncharacterized protein LOC113771254 [Coffea eugenioides]